MSNDEYFKFLSETWRFQVDSYWTRTSYFAVFETAALGAVVSLAGHKQPCFAILGSISAFAWLLNNKITHGYVNYWWKALKIVELRLGPQFLFANNHKRKCWIRYHWVVQAMPILFIVAWLGVLFKIPIHDHLPVWILHLGTCTAIGSR